MSTRSYRGNRGKNVYEIANFSKGVNATNAAMPPGYLKELVNMNISPDGLSLRPREPYLNYVLYLENQKKFVTLSNQVTSFISKQFPTIEFIVDLFGTRHGYEKKIESYRVIDGDTIEDLKTKIRYRLLIVDAYELNTPEGKAAKGHLEGLLAKEPITVRYDSQAPSWVDKFNRHLVWIENFEGINVNLRMITNNSAKYLDIDVTEHEGGILKTYFNNVKDYNGEVLNIQPYPGGIPTVYRRDIKKEPQIIDGRPAYIVHEFNNIFMGDMLIDLGLAYSYLPSIFISKTSNETQHYRTQYTPIEYNKMSTHDGVVGLVNVDVVGIKLIGLDIFNTQSIRYSKESYLEKTNNVPLNILNLQTIKVDVVTKTNEIVELDLINKTNTRVEAHSVVNERVPINVSEKQIIITSEVTGRNVSVPISIIETQNIRYSNTFVLNERVPISITATQNIRVSDSSSTSHNVSLIISHKQDVVQLKDSSINERVPLSITDTQNIRFYLNDEVYIPPKPLEILRPEVYDYFCLSRQGGFKEIAIEFRNDNDFSVAVYGNIGGSWNGLYMGDLPANSMEILSIQVPFSETVPGQLRIWLSYEGREDGEGLAISLEYEDVTIDSCRDI